MKDNTKVFEEYTIPKAVMTMALPSMLSMLINIVYNLADTFFVGQTGDSNQVAAVSVSMPLFLLFIATGNLFGVGGCAFVSRSLGEGRKDRVKTISAFCIYASIAVGLVLGIIFFTLKNQILMLVGASENTLGLAADYLKWVALGAPSIVLSITASNLVRGEGAAKESMIGSVIGQITNIILDPIFILHTGDKLFGINMPFGFDMGVAGVLAWQRGENRLFLVRPVPFRHPLPRLHGEGQVKRLARLLHDDTDMPLFARAVHVLPFQCQHVADT